MGNRRPRCRFVNTAAKSTRRSFEAILLSELGKLTLVGARQNAAAGSGEKARAISWFAIRR